MSNEQRNQLRSIRTFPSLIKYLHDELDWPVTSDRFEDLTFEYTPEELGIDPASAAKIQGIKRLRPLAVDQPWGIFFVKFEPKRLPVVALRRILSRVALKKRASANSAERVAWEVDDLLFISNYGEGDKRHISLAHFSRDGGRGDLPTLKVLGWDNLDTPLHLDSVVETLTSSLIWPKDEQDLDSWREGWRAAFQVRHCEVITTARDLSIRLAELARAIRDRIDSALAIESAAGPLTKLMKAFQEALVHDLDAVGFADMYAQTIAYGLLSARIADPTKSMEDDLAGHMRTNPFLKELMEAFVNVGGRGVVEESGIDFDELGVSEVVELLGDANMEAVLVDFGDRNPQEDPVIHFYEHFLAAYDKEQKVKRGVFYTPRPVVSYIVRSVDELLRTEFGLADGLADTTTWGELARGHSGVQIPEGVSPDQVFVQVLDPATGTGTFLVEVIDLIHETMVVKWRTIGHDELTIQDLWNEYVPKHLLPRLHGYELLMAPYAIAHLKIGLKLYETGYRFASEERARVYLTNALEQASDAQLRLGFLPALAHEASAVSDVKRRQKFSVVIGNPPYSSLISEPPWLMTLLEDWKKGLNETKSDLNREEWKFLRLSQHLCQESGCGVVGFIINRDFLDGITKRRMREHLGETFLRRAAIDLNGDVKGNIADENVFDIEQGVAIAVLCTLSNRQQLQYSSRVGSRAEKYADLISRKPIDGDLATVEPVAPYFRWLPFSDGTAELASEYYLGLPLNEIFTVYSSGIQTKRDSLCVAFSAEEVWDRVTRLNELSEEEARREFGLGKDGRDWSVALAKADIATSGPSFAHVSPLLYRPFDTRATYWTGRTKGFLAYPRRDVMQHVVGHENLGMIFNRQIVGDRVSHFGVSRIPICHGTFYLGNKGQDYFAPLYLFHPTDITSEANAGTSNLSPGFVSEILRPFGTRPEVPTSPEDVFNYVYAVVNSPTYRDRYKELLKLDFARVPVPGSVGLFDDLAALGAKLVRHHLFESPNGDVHSFSYIGQEARKVERVGWSDGTVWIDAGKTSARDGHRATTPGSSGFKGVSERAWDFHIGGYQVCHKWLKDRKGRVLSDEDVAHYQKIVVAINETIRLTGEIDDVIEEHGGWPDAFQAVETKRDLPVETLKVAENKPVYGDS